MKIAVLSGKGGTGKTFISTNLCKVSKNSTYLDCDVEEPNGHLFFEEQEPIERIAVNVPFPEFDKEKCNGCKICADNCKFNAIAVVEKTPILFSEVCHYCGLCTKLCPEKVITEQDHQIGKIEIYNSNSTKVVTGYLDTGEVSGIPVIEKVLDFANENLTIIDCPPGSACSTMASIKISDYCIIVAEPTVFGLHNMKMVIELVKLFNKPFGIIINKETEKNTSLHKWLNQNKIKVIDSIPWDKDIADSNAHGKTIEKTKSKFNTILKAVIKDTSK